MSNYTFKDLEIMQDAPQYIQWIAGLLEPFIVGRVLEIGAGIGNITRKILEKCARIESLSCIEPDLECSKELEKSISQNRQNIPIAIHNADLMLFNQSNLYDVVFAVNVLEHIKDDLSALEKIHSLLVDNGRLLLFLPAFQCLYGPIDKELKHYRRYSKKKLRNKLDAARFFVEEIRYYNAVGFLGWWLNKLSGKTIQSHLQIRIFDGLILPIQQRLEAILGLPFGQSLFCVARKR